MSNVPFPSSAGPFLAARSQERPPCHQEPSGIEFLQTWPEARQSDSDGLRPTSDGLQSVKWKAYMAYPQDKKTRA